MIEIHPNLFVGSSEDVPHVLSDPNWYVVHAAKFPWHRQAVGYAGPAAPKGHPEYLYALRDRSIALNLVDAPDPGYIPEELVRAALLAITVNIEKSKVLVHCNQGLSRSPTLALLWMRKHTNTFADMSHAEAVEKFRAIYPDYAPAAGMDGYAEAHW